MLEEKIFNEFFYGKSKTLFRQFGTSIIKILDIDNELYFSYLMMDTVKNSKNKSYHINEILYFKITRKEIHLLISSKISIYNFINSKENKFRFGKINNKIYESKTISDIKEIEDRICKNNIFIN